MTDVDPRILKHIEALANAGTDLDAFVAALAEIRTDRNLTRTAKTAILKTLAMEQSIHYLSACTGLKALTPD
jgi:hypothetical protein